VQRTCAICTLEHVWFSPPPLSESASGFRILTICLFRGMMAFFDIHVYMYIIARETLLLPCKIGRTPYDAQHTSNNGGRASAKVIIHRRWPGRYVTTQKIFLIVLCPGDYQIRR